MTNPSPAPAAPEIRHRHWCCDPTIRTSTLPLDRYRIRYRCLGCRSEATVLGGGDYPPAGQPAPSKGIRDE